MLLATKVIAEGLLGAFLPRSLRGVVASLVDTSTIKPNDLESRLKLFKPFVTNFVQNLDLHLSLADYGPLNHESSFSNRRVEFFHDFTAKLADPTQSLPAIISWLLSQKADETTYFFPPPATADNEQVSHGFKALISLVNLGKADTDVFVVLEEYASQYLEYSPQTLYQITNNNRLAALDFLERFGMHCAETVYAVREVLRVCHDDGLRRACHRVLRASQKQLPDIVFQKILTTPIGSAEEQALADCCDQFCGAISEERAQTLIARYNTRENQVSLSALWELLAGQVQLGRLLRSSLIKNNHWVKQGKINEQLAALAKLKDSLDDAQGGFSALLNIWGLDTALTLSQSQLPASFIAALTQASLQAWQALPDKLKVDPEASATAICITEFARSQWQADDLRQQIRFLADFLSQANCRFDHEVFRAIFAVLAQRDTQTMLIAEKVITAEEHKTAVTRKNYKEAPILGQIHPPHYFYPLIEVLRAQSCFQRLSFPQDAFLELEVSCWLNTFFPHVAHPDHGYQLWLLQTLLEHFPMAINADGNNRKLMRDSIQDLDDESSNAHPIFAFMRKRIHSNPSPADYTFCLTLLTALSQSDPVGAVLAGLIPLLSDFPVEAASLESSLVDHRAELAELSVILNALKTSYPDIPLELLVEQAEFDARLVESSNNNEALVVALNLLTLCNSLHKRWCRRLADQDIMPLLTDADQAIWPTANTQQRLQIVKANRNRLRLELTTPQRDIQVTKELFRRQHIFGRMGLIATYTEPKLTCFQADRTLAIVQRELLEQLQAQQVTALAASASQPLNEMLVNDGVAYLTELLDYFRREGLSFSQSFLDIKNMLAKDPLSLTKLKDLLVALQYKESRHFNAFIIYKFRRYMARIFKRGKAIDFPQSFQRPESVPEERYVAWAVESALAKIHDNPDKMIKQLGAYVTEFSKYIAPFFSKNMAFRTTPAQTRADGELSPATTGSKGFNLSNVKAKLLNLVQIPALEILPVDLFINDERLLRPEGRGQLTEIVMERILRIEAASGKIFDFAACGLTAAQIAYVSNERLSYSWVTTRQDITKAPKLSLSIRGGAFPSLPGVLGTVLHAGRKPLEKRDLSGLSEDAQRSLLEAERVFLSTYGSVVLGIPQARFSEIIVQKKREISRSKQGLTISLNPWVAGWQVAINLLTFWNVGHAEEPVAKDLPSIAELSNDVLWAIIKEHRCLIRRESTGKLSPNPLANILEGIIAIWKSWDSNTARKAIDTHGYADDWRSAVILQDMREPQGHANSFSSILFTGDPDDPSRKPFGNISFGKVGEDLASGLSNNSVALETLATTKPALYKRICEILEQVRAQSGQVHMEIELVGEYDSDKGGWSVELNWDLFLLQLRQVPVTGQPLSAKFDVAQASVESAKQLTKGEGMLGGAQHFILVNAIGKTISETEDLVRELRAKLGPKDEQNGPAIYILLEYVTSEESPKIIYKHVDGVITTTDSCSHGSVAAWGNSKVYIAKTGLARYDKTREWFWGGSGEIIHFAESDTTDFQYYTAIGHPPHIAGELSGAIFAGKLPLVERDADY